MLLRLQKSMNEKDKGFTLIELLVVVIIIGILAGIAIPVFLNQRKKGVDASLKSDVRNAANSIETYITDNPTTSTASVAQIKTTPYGFKESSGNTVTITNITAGGYCITATNSGATSAAGAVYDSSKGGLQPSGAVCSATGSSVPAAASGG